MCAVNIEPTRDPISSVPPLSLHRTPAEQAARTLWLLRILSRLTMVVSFILCAVAWKRAGDDEAAAAEAGKALAWLEWITAEVRAVRLQDEAREARLFAEHAAACAAAARAAEMAAKAVADAAGQLPADVIPLPAGAGAMRNHDVLWMLTRVRSFGPRAACAGLAVPRFGGWRGPPWERFSKTGFAGGVFVCP